MDKPLTDAELDALTAFYSRLIPDLLHGLSVKDEEVVRAIAELRALREQNTALVTALEEIFYSPGCRASGEGSTAKWAWNVSRQALGARVGGAE